MTGSPGNDRVGIPINWASSFPLTMAAGSMTVLPPPEESTPSANWGWRKSDKQSVTTFRSDEAPPSSPQILMLVGSPDGSLPHMSDLYECAATLAIF